MDSEDFEVLGPAVANSSILTALMVLLVAKGVMTRDDRVHVMDAALSMLERQELLEPPERRLLWSEAKSYVATLMRSF
ncbi:MAG: hypothetical protein JWM91_3374 [Rhodospirillales bacterium]|nr:hypothetical protein [Rhodospirillales bacterium]